MATATANIRQDARTLSHDFSLFTTNESFRNVGIYGTVDVPLFVYNDVAVMINKRTKAYELAQSAIYVEHEHYEYIKINSRTGAHTTLALTEKGLYRVMFESTSPVAREFQVFTCEALEEMRLHGHTTIARVNERVHDHNEALDQHLLENQHERNRMAVSHADNTEQEILYLQECVQHDEQQRTLLHHKVHETDKLYAYIDRINERYGRTFYVHALGAPAHVHGVDSMANAFAVCANYNSHTVNDRHEAQTVFLGVFDRNTSELGVLLGRIYVPRAMTIECVRNLFVENYRYNIPVCEPVNVLAMPHVDKDEVMSNCFRMSYVDVVDIVRAESALHM